MSHESLSHEELAQTPDLHVLIRHEEFHRFTATYQFGTQKGEIDGRVDEVWTHAAQLFLTFVGTDGGDKVFGASGDVVDNAKDEEIIDGTIRYHHGDDLPFVSKGVQRLKPSSRRVRKCVPVESRRGTERTATIKPFSVKPLPRTKAGHVGPKRGCNRSACRTAGSSHVS